MAELTFTYRAFISYSHADQAWARWLHRYLETYRIPRRLSGADDVRRLGKVFRDEEELGAASELGPKLEAALRGSEVLIVICSPRAANSPWVNKEIAAFKGMGREHRVYALIVDGEPHKSADECFPEALKTTTSGAVAEPLAVDVRKFGREDAGLRLIAGILDVNYDDLRQRELRRRRAASFRANAILATGLALICAALVGGYLAAANYVDASERTSSLFAREAQQLNDAGDYAKAMQMALSGDASAQAGWLERAFRPQGFAKGSAALVRSLTHNRLLRSTEVGEWVEPSQVSLDRFREPVEALATVDGTHTVVTGTGDGWLKAFDARDGRLLQRHQLGAGIKALAVSRRGDIVLAGLKDGRVIGWRPSSDTVIQLGAESSGVRAVAIAPNDAEGNAIFEDGRLKRWDLRNGQALAEWRAGHGVRIARFEPDTSVVLLIGGEGRPELRRVMDGVPVAQFEVEAATVQAATFSADGEGVLIAQTGGTTSRFAMAGGPALSSLATEANVTSLLDAGDKGLLTGHDDGAIRTWSPSGLLVQTFAGSRDVLALALGERGEVLFSGSRGGILRSWAISPSPPPSILRVGPAVLSVSYSPDSTKLAVASLDGLVRVWSTRDNRLLQTFRAPHAAEAIASLANDPYAIAAASVAYAPDGKSVAAGFIDRQVVVWSAENGATLRRVDGFDGGVVAVAFSPESDRVAAAWGYSFGIWPASGGAQAGVFPKGIRPVRSVAFSHDGQRVVTGSGERTAKIWPASGGAATVELVEKNIVSAARFSADDTRILTGSWFGTARIWPASGGAPYTSMTGHRGAVNSVDFSPDEKWVVTGGLDGQAKIWSSAGGPALATLSGHQKAVTTVAWAPDGRSVATGSEDGTVRIWPVPAQLSASSASRAQAACKLLSAIGQPYSQDDVLRYPILDRLAPTPCTSRK